MSEDRPPGDAETEAQTDSMPGQPGSALARIGRYRLLQLVGRGGMGEVWEAQQEEPVRRRVALKLIKLGMDTRSFVARFESERQALAIMDHPNIAHVFDAGATEQGRPYFVMEYVRGSPITQFADEHRLGIRERIEIFVRVCGGVQHAHQKAIIHRDLKPSNILVSLQDGEPSPKIIDFGLAKAIGQPLTDQTAITQLGQRVGTPDYMSPEQAGMVDADVDTRSDVYSLGVVLYELLTGSAPHDVDSRSSPRRRLDALRQQIAGVDPTRPSSRIRSLADADAARVRRSASPAALARRLKRDLDWITMKALERDRERRYETASALAMDLRRHLGSEPVMAGPPSITYRARKFVRRHRFAVAFAGLILLMLSVFAVRESLHVRQLAIERDTAQQVSDFMIELFQVADPNRPQGTEITARELLDNAVNRVEDELAEQPEVQARMMSTLGAIYQRLGIFEPSQRLLEAALTTRRQVLGDEHPDTLTTLNDLATVLNAQGRLDEADTLYRQAIETSRRVLGDRHPRTLQMVSNLCTVVRQQGKLEEAERLCREAVDGLRDHGGIDDQDAIVALQILGAVHVDQARLAEAEDCFRQALESSRRVLGNDHPNTLHAISGMSYLLKEQGKFAEAEPYYREALESRRRVLGDDHPSTLTSLTNMGLFLKQQGRLDEAETFYRQALEGCRRVLGDDHDETLVAVNNLGVLLKTQGRYEEAEPFYRDAISGYQRLLGDDHPRTLLARRNLGILRKEQGRFEEAEQLITQALDGGRRALGEDHPSVAVTLNALGELAVAQGELAKAENRFQDSLELAEAALGPAHPTLARILRNLARVHARQDRYDASDACYERALSILEPIRGEGHPQVEKMREERAQMLSESASS